MQQRHEHFPYRERIRNDPSFALELRWCTEHAVPHSKWLSWDPDDRAKIIASLMEDSERCQMCGTAEWEWKADKRAYQPVEDLCLGCYYTDRAREERQSMPGVTIRMVPTSMVTDEMIGGIPGEG